MRRVSNPANKYLKLGGGRYRLLANGGVYGMNLVKVFNLLFPAPPSNASTKKKLKEREVNVVSRYARGNVALQNGVYMSSSDIEKLKQSTLFR